MTPQERKMKVKTRNVDSENTKKSIRFLNIFSPLFTAMRIFGLNLNLDCSGSTGNRIVASSVDTEYAVTEAGCEQHGNFCKTQKTESFPDTNLSKGKPNLLVKPCHAAQEITSLFHCDSKAKATVHTEDETSKETFHSRARKKRSLPRRVYAATLKEIPCGKEFSLSSTATSKRCFADHRAKETWIDSTCFSEKTPNSYGDCEAESDSNQDWSGGRRFRAILWRCYSLLEMLIFWLYVFISCYSLAEGRRELFLTFRITLTFWLVFGAMISTIFFRVSLTGWMQNVITLLDEYRLEAEQAGISHTRCLRRLKTAVRAAVFAGVVLILIHACGYTVLYWVIENGSSMIACFFVTPFVLNYLTLTLTFVTLGFFAAVSIFSHVFVITLVISLLHLFETLSREIMKEYVETQTHEHEKELCGKLRTYRQLYLQLARITALVDKHVSSILAVSILITIGLCVFAIYRLVATDLPGQGYWMFVVWVVINVTSFFGMASQCSRLHSKAKSPLMTLLGVRSASNNPEHAAELNLFIQAIIHGNVGITAFDIVTITKETILTIIGVVVSYFFVIIQFKIQ